LNRLFVANKPLFLSSNGYLNRIKRRYKVKKAGFSGTLDPFATGSLIIAFGQYTKLFNYLNKTPKKYFAVIWLGVQSSSLDIENITSMDKANLLDIDEIKNAIGKFKGSIEYVPPKYSAKKIGGKRAYELARNETDFEMQKSVMEVFSMKFVNYNHPFISFEAEVGEGSYIRSLAQMILKKLGSVGTLSYLKRSNEGKFFFDNEKSLDPTEYLNIPKNSYSGDIEWMKFGKKLQVEYFEKKDNGIYLIDIGDSFSIIEIKDAQVSYLINKMEKNG
jgi:tRNA pseudouridine55 synthase